MSWFPGDVGFAAKFLAGWDFHERNYVPLLMQRLDADEWIDRLEAKLRAPRKIRSRSTT